MSQQKSILFIYFFFVLLCESIANDDIIISKIAFGSCTDEEKNQPILQRVLEYNPELFLFLGDNIYGTVNQGQIVPQRKILQSIEQAYINLNKNHLFKKIRNTIPLLAIWDDHDYGVNDGGREFPYKRESKNLFLKFWNISTNDPRRNREGLYFSKTYGQDGNRLQIIVLDTRYFRSPINKSLKNGSWGYHPDNNPNKTILGLTQWDWLETKLKETADLRLIISSIQVIPDQHRFEKWGNFPLEREKLFRLIETTLAQGTIFISGDRHFSAIYKREIPPLYPIHEITSSSINKPTRRKRISETTQIVKAYKKSNFSTADIDWNQKKVTLSIIDIDGKVVRQKVIFFDDLKF